ncbi:MAG: contractile injection system protein, VgrG/Pvc8 family [Methylococcaceae bacterium]|nr:contractile injection system protein, VgrG/Pvc8 family [Methylococcaceae bacterium]
MSSSYQLWVDGQPADADLIANLASLEVEENFDLPGAVQLHFPVTRTEKSDLSFVSDGRLKPFVNLAVVATVVGKADECIFDGYVLAHKLHLQRGVTDSKLEVWGKDASWLMNLEEKTREWVDVTDTSVASTVFGEYGMDPAPDNTQDDSPTHAESGHSLMQRGSDSQFLKRLATANGKIFRIACADKPGKRSGYFARPKLDGEAVLTLSLNDPDHWMVDALDFDWDVMGPSAVKASQALFTDSDPNGASADAADSGLATLADRNLAAFAGKSMSAMLTAPVDDAGELKLRAQALLRDAGWFVRCEGEADLARMQQVLRVGTLVQIEGVGALNTGKYLVWSVRHTIQADSHKMKFVFVRNAVGPEPSGGGGGLLGGLL